MTDRLLPLGLESQANGLLTSAKFWNKKLIIFNSASFCGFTKQLGEFQDIFKQGLAVPIAIPTNDFGNQEPGDNYEILQCYTQKHDVEYPVTTKQTIEHEFFKVYGKPSWNFNKYLFDEQHNFVERFESKVTPKEVLNYAK